VLPAQNSKVEYHILNNITVTSREEEPHIAVCHHHLRIAISVTAAAAPRLPRASFDPTYQ
jgi:hypothetical protein